MSSSCAFAQVRCRKRVEKGWSKDIMAIGQGEHNRTSVVGWFGYLTLFLYLVYSPYEMCKVEVDAGQAAAIRASETSGRAACLAINRGVR